MIINTKRQSQGPTSLDYPTKQTQFGTKGKTAVKTHTTVPLEISDDTSNGMNLWYERQAYLISKMTRLIIPCISGRAIRNL